MSHSFNYLFHVWDLKYPWSVYFKLKKICMPKIMCELYLISVLFTHQSQDIPTGADSCVTSLACDSMGRSLLIAGCGDGSVRLYDRRLAPAEW